MKASTYTQPTISATAWTSATEPCPAQVGFPSQENFPAGLIWSGTGEVPAIGARVQIYLNGIGAAEVKAYFHYEGFLGVLVAPDTMPAHLQNQRPAITLCHVYGIDLEPRRPRPGASLCIVADPTPEAGTAEDWIAEYPQAAEEATPAEQVRYYRYKEFSRLTVVRGELSDYHRFYDVEAFTGSNAQDSAQLADPANWSRFKDYQLLEIRPDGEVAILEQCYGENLPVLNRTAQYPGPFRIPGHPPVSKSGEADEYPTLRALATEMQKQTPGYRGRTIERAGKINWFPFEEEGMQDVGGDWQRVELTLSEAPLEAYQYHAGERADAQHPSMGTATLWQEQGGEGRYFVEVSPTHNFAPGFSYLEQEQPDRLRTWWRFQMSEVEAG